MTDNALLRDMTLVPSGVVGGARVRCTGCLTISPVVFALLDADHWAEDHCCAEASG